MPYHSEPVVELILLIYRLVYTVLFRLYASRNSTRVELSWLNAGVLHSVKVIIACKLRWQNIPSKEFSSTTQTHPATRSMWNQVFPRGYWSSTIHYHASICMISGFRCEVDEICALLGYYADYSCNSLPTFRDNLSVPSVRVMILDPWRWGPIGCP